MTLCTLPDEILHSIFSYVAESPSLIGSCICALMRPLSKHWRHELDTKRDLWELAMNDLTCDYYISYEHPNDAQTSSQQHVAPIQTSSVKRARLGSTSSPRRSNRLRPATPKERYIHSYNLLLSRNESALLELQECAHSTKKPLSLSMLKKLLKEYEPIAINRRVRSGGTFLVEVVRARHVKESVILKCAKLLIENGANPNIPSAEVGMGITSKATILYDTSAASGEVGKCISSSTGAKLYPLIIAAARGMSSVVDFLLSVGAFQIRQFE
ncbi:hypothetical protein ACHAXH_009894 [Discostella pseudostelligera]